MKPPDLFTLPEHPIDRHEIVFYIAEPDYDPGVTEVRLLYHANRTWREVCPDDDHLRDGAPFKDQWQVFRGKHFTGRLVGWPAPLKWGGKLEGFGWDRCFHERAQAVAESVRVLRYRARNLTAELHDVLAKAARLEGCPTEGAEPERACQREPYRVVSLTPGTTGSRSSTASARASA